MKGGRSSLALVSSSVGQMKACEYRVQTHSLHQKPYIIFLMCALSTECLRVFVLFVSKGIHCKQRPQCFLWYLVSLQNNIFVNSQVVCASLWTKNSWLTPLFRSIAQDITHQNTSVLFLSTSEQVQNLFVQFQSFLAIVLLYRTSNRTRYCEQHYSIFLFIPTNCVYKLFLKYIEHH